MANVLIIGKKKGMERKGEKRKGRKGATACHIRESTMPPRAPGVVCPVTHGWRLPGRGVCSMNLPWAVSYTEP